MYPGFITFIAWEFQGLFIGVFTFIEDIFVIKGYTMVYFFFWSCIEMNAKQPTPIFRLVIYNAFYSDEKYWIQNFKPLYITLIFP